MGKTTLNHFYHTRNHEAISSLAKRAKLDRKISSPQRKLTDEQVKEIRIMYETGVMSRRDICALCVKKYNISESYCHKILEYEVRVKHVL